ncbi:MAG: ATP-grasp domain-containing protein [Proteobacteria bacterium]|nr:ATP-grasp domain-containing protein [Pseudomonadota bacterium]
MNKKQYENRNQTTINIFVYNVVQIKANFLDLKKISGNQKFILIASNYCIDNMTAENYSCFDEIYNIPRNFHHADYDIVEKVVGKYIKEYGAKNIKLMTNEDSAQMTCAKIRENNELHGLRVEEIQPFVYKTTSKKLVKKIVKTPKFLHFNKAEYITKKEGYLKKISEKLNLPMFIKPVDLVSSLYTYRIDDLDTLRNIADEIITYEYEFEVDEFINGDIFHCDIVFNNSEILFFAACKYAFHLATFSKGNPMGGIQVIDSEIYKKLEEFTKKVTQELKCKNGAYHLEVFLEYKSNDLIFLEIAARTPGALVSNIYEIQYGFHIEEWHYLAHMGLLNNPELNNLNKFAGWITYPQEDGVIERFIKPSLDVKYKFIEHVSVGEKTNAAKSLLDATCSIIFWDTSLQKVHDDFEILKYHKPVTFKKTSPQKDQLNNNLKSSHLIVIDQLFKKLPFLFWKNKKGVYLGCNLNQAKAFNFSSISEFTGKTIFEILQDQKAARQVDKIDNEIMKSGKEKIFEETIPTPFGIKTYISHKQPLYDDGKIIGLLGFSTDITEIKEQESLAKAESERLIKENHALEIDYYKKSTQQQTMYEECLDSLQNTIQLHKINALNKKLGIKTGSNNKMTDKSQKLTKRELDVLYYLSLNKSPKEIASILSILENKSIKSATIQAVIDKGLYDKLGAYSIAQLIETATILKLIPFMLNEGL